MTDEEPIKADKHDSCSAPDLVVEFPTYCRPTISAVALYMIGRKLLLASPIE
ncbi:unnamed protein product [Schistosoma curassoni]|uniref:Uncharacterized protein n=1 Tax=Schistosoma curassoni TaxID=6186 RepID=A0A183K4E3_9TREM|nr:unnamed protein product [Schistosoma curassoni]